MKQTFWDFCAGTATAMNSYTVNDLFSAQCAKQSLFKRPARDACLCMGELQAPPAPHFVFLITL